MEHKIINNFMDRHDFFVLKNTLLGDNFPWYYSSGVSTTEDKNYYFIHTFHDGKTINSDYFDLLNPIFSTINIKAIIRIKANFYPCTKEIENHGFHLDQNFQHKGLVFYINSNDGYTELENGTKIESVENKVLLFDSSKLHRSTSCTNCHGRVTINMNYF